MAVLGANGNDTLVLLGNYHGTPYGNEVSTPFAAITERVGADRSSFKLGAWPSGEGTWAFGNAIVAASAADVAVITIGSSSKGTLNGFTFCNCKSNPHCNSISVVVFSGDAPERVLVIADTTIEKESLDRKSLTLPGMQLDLVKAIASQTTTPIIVVLIHGGPLDIAELMEMPRVEAVLSAGYGGQCAGSALTNVLWGVTSPSGRLPMSWTFDNYTHQVSEADMAMRPWPGRTHRFLQVPVLFKFGFGLSYSKWEHAINVSARSDAAATVSVTAKNIGSVASARVVLLFGTPPPLTNDDNATEAIHMPMQPQQVLLGFEKLPSIQPGAECMHTFELATHDAMALSDHAGIARRLEGCWDLTVDDAHAELCVGGP